MRSTLAASGTLIIIWVGFMVLMIVGITLVFLWGVRTGQFENQERARHLPLWSRIEEDDEKDERGDGPPAAGAAPKDTTS